MAHTMEDALHLEVLKAIVRGAPQAGRLAELALGTRDIAFGRWCA